MDMISKLFLIEFVHVNQKWLLNPNFKRFLSHFNHLDVVSFQNSFPMQNSEFRNNFNKSFRL